MQIPDSPMSQRAYARRRGINHVAVRRAILSGRLVRSVRDGKIIDPDLADQEWDANTDYSEAPVAVVERAEERRRAQSITPSDGGGVTPPCPAPDPVTAREGMSLGEASAAEKVWRAKLAELKFQREAAELVPAAGVRAKLEDVFRVCRTKLLGVPSRARQLLPELSAASIATLEELVREALEELSQDVTT